MNSPILADIRKKQMVGKDIDTTTERCRITEDIFFRNASKLKRMAKEKYKPADWQIAHAFATERIAFSNYPMVAEDADVASQTKKASSFLLKVVAGVLLLSGLAYVIVTHVTHT